MQQAKKVMSDRLCSRISRFCPSLARLASEVSWEIFYGKPKYCKALFTWRQGALANLATQLGGLKLITNIPLMKGTVPETSGLCYNFGTSINIHHLFIVVTRCHAA